MARKLDIDYSQHDFKFERNWFRNRNLSSFREIILPQWQKQQIAYLEIGVFEGQSLVWMMQRVLTHPASRAIGIDPWLQTTKLSSRHMEDVMARAHHNLAPWKHRCILSRGNSAEILRRMAGRHGHLGVKQGTLDLIMIDGNHFAPYVVDDANHCLKLLKKGGWMIFDDVENDIKKENHVKQGMDMFLAGDGKDMKFVAKDRYIEVYEKP